MALATGSGHCRRLAPCRSLGDKCGEPQGARRGFYRGKRNPDLPVASAIPLTVSAIGLVPCRSLGDLKN